MTFETSAQNSAITDNVQIVSANNLLSGNIVYLTPDKGWSRELTEALLIDQPDTASELLETLEADQSVVLSPIVIDALLHRDGSIELSHFRNKFRESGPTHRSY